MSEETEVKEPAPEPVLPVDVAIADMRAQIALFNERLAWLLKHREKIKELPRPTFCGNRVDFDNLPHADVVKVIRSVGGKWKKEAHTSETINYESQTEIDGHRVRCYNGKPPPSCKIIEVEEHVPAQVIPATVRKVRKLVCHPEVGAVIATAREKGLAANPDLSATTLTDPAVTSTGSQSETGS